MKGALTSGWKAFQSELASSSKGAPKLNVFRFADKAAFRVESNVTTKEVYEKEFEIRSFCEAARVTRGEPLLFSHILSDEKQQAIKSSDYFRSRIDKWMIPGPAGIITSLSFSGIVVFSGLSSGIAFAEVLFVTGFLSALCYPVICVAQAFYRVDDFEKAHRKTYILQRLGAIHQKN